METFRVVTEGHALPGFNLAEVREQFTRLTSSTEETVAGLFGGSPTTVKKAVDASTAERYIATLKGIGVACHVEAETINVDLAPPQTVPPGQPPVPTPSDSIPSPRSSRSLGYALIASFVVVSYLLAEMASRLVMGTINEAAANDRIQVILGTGVLTFLGALVILKLLRSKRSPQPKVNPPARNRRGTMVVAALLMVASATVGVLTSRLAAETEIKAAARQKAFVETKARNDRVAAAQQDQERQRFASLTPQQQEAETKQKTERLNASIIQEGDALLKRWREREAWSSASLAGKNLREPDGKLVSKKEWADVEGHLRSVQASQPEYGRAQALLTAMAQETRKAAAAQAAHESVARANSRKEFAQNLERVMVDKRMNVDVATSGNKNTTLTIKWVLASKVTANDLSKSGIVENAENAGFKKVIFTDGYNSSWSWTLTPRPD